MTHTLNAKQSTAKNPFIEFHKTHCAQNLMYLYSRVDTKSIACIMLIVTSVPVRTCRSNRRFHRGVGESSTPSWSDNMAAKKGRKKAAKKGGRKAAKKTTKKKAAKKRR